MQWCRKQMYQHFVQQLLVYYFPTRCLSLASLNSKLLNTQGRSITAQISNNRKLLVASAKMFLSHIFKFYTIQPILENENFLIGDSQLFLKELKGVWERLDFPSALLMLSLLKTILAGFWNDTIWIKIYSPTTPTTSWVKNGIWEPLVVILFQTAFITLKSAYCLSQRADLSWKCNAVHKP